MPKRWTALGEILDRCIRLELAAGQLYFRFSRSFEKHAAMRRFWFAMAIDESSHADVLKRAKAFIEAGAAYTSTPLVDWGRIAALEDTLKTYCAATGREDFNLKTALEIAVEFETSEVNDIYQQLCFSLDPRLRRAALRLARPMEEHLGRLATAIRQYLPECDDMARRLNPSVEKLALR